MRLVIAGGGTGGHLYPGIAIAEELMQKDPAARVLFVGTARGLEARVCPKQGWPLELIDASGLKTVGALGALRGFGRLPRALLQSRMILRRFGPDVVIGVGGYASGPVVLSAWLSRIPTAIVEPNSIPGLANKILGRIVAAIFVAFPETGRYFKSDRVVVSGNPIRRAIREPLAPKADRPAQRPHVFVCGGSLGAKAVNQLATDALIELVRCGIDMTITHQTGKDDRDAVAAKYREAGINAQVSEFIEDMAREYGRADLVVSRAGATTVAELTHAGRAAILIPYPFAADNHQEVNARALEAAGAALVFLQRDLDGPRLAAAIRGLLEQPDRLKRMQSAMRSLARPDAAGAIVDWLRKAH